MLIHILEIGGPQKPPISISREKDGGEGSGFAEILQRMVRVEIDYLPLLPKSGLKNLLHPSLYRREERK